MPIKKITYMCEKCGAEYKDKAGAVNCEISHCPVSSFEALYGAGQNDPSVIEVTMRSGRILKFYPKQR